MPRNGKDTTRKVKREEEVESAITFHFHRVVAAMESRQLKDLRRFGLNTSRWRVLSCLEQKGACTIGELAAYMVVQQPVVSRVVAEMERDGLLKRQGSKSDQRVVTIDMTPAGWSLFREVIPVILQHRAALSRTLTSEDKDLLMRALKRMEENLGIA